MTDTRADPDVMATDDDDIIAEAKDRLRLCIQATDTDRNLALEDLKFKNGEHWRADEVQQRDIDGRPCLTVNTLPATIHQVTNDIRQNRQAIHVHPVDDDADIDTAEVIEGMCRHIEYDSGADAAYDTATESAASIGFGFFRLITEYCDPMSFDQVMKIKRVRNPFTIYIDPAAQEADGSDMQFAFVTSKVPKQEFKRLYPKATADYDAIGRGVGDGATDWQGADDIRVAEYYRIEHVSATLVRLSNGKTQLSTDKTPLPIGVVPMETRHTFVRRIVWFKLTGKEILERAQVPFDWIPIFPVYGDEIDIDGDVTRSGMIRNAKDPVRMYDYWLPLSLDTQVPTPKGWATIGAIREGDQVFDEQGQPCDVLGKSPVYINRDCFRVEFDDGSHIIADGQHPWMIERLGKRVAKSFEWSTMKVATSGIKPGQDFIWAPKAIDTPDADLPIDPYLLGYWLGDGNSASVSFTVQYSDVEEVRAQFASTGHDVGPIHNVSREGDAAHFSVKGLMPTFRAAGLIQNKHIPDMYLRASKAQRLELLRGLMDTDGSISTKAAQCSFSTTRHQILSGFVELLRSLGIKSTMIKREGRTSLMANGHAIVSGEITQVSFSAPDEAVFKLSRKAAVQASRKPRCIRRSGRYAIKAVVPVPSVPVQCIAVSSASHLFLAGPSMIPTHNTSATEEIALRTKTPYIGALGQFEGVEEDWNSANTRSFSYLEYNPVTIDGSLAPAPQRQPPADVPSGYIAMAGIARDNIKAVTGIYDASLGNRSNETSGIAIKSRQSQGEIANFHIADNLGRAIRHLGRTMVSGFKYVYDTERVSRILGVDGTADHVAINQPNPNLKPDEKTGAIKHVLNDMTVGTYDVVVKAGPAYSTLREEAADQMVAVGQAFPKLMDVAGDLVVKSFDWPGAEEISERLAKTLPPGLADSDDDEQADMVQTPKGPIPKQQAGQLIGQMDQALEQMQGELEQHESKFKQSQLDADTRVKIAEINAASKLDNTELAGMIELLMAKMDPLIAHQAAVVAAADPEHPDAPAPIAQGIEQAPAQVQQADQSHQQAMDMQAAQPAPEAGSASASEGASS